MFVSVMELAFTNSLSLAVTPSYSLSLTLTLSFSYIVFTKWNKRFTSPESGFFNQYLDKKESFVKNLSLYTRLMGSWFTIINQILYCSCSCHTLNAREHKLKGCLRIYFVIHTISSLGNTYLEKSELALSGNLCTT